MPPLPHPTPPVPPEALNGGADTMWTNLGDWSTTRSYPAAARALALRVGTAAALGPADVVVDYACGYGDSLRLWVEQFDVRRAVGVEPDPRVCRVLRDRVAAWGLESRLRIVQSAAEQLAPRQADAEVSAVVCVDAAYHFASRQRWWTMLARDLGAAARIATADLLLADGHRAGLGLRAVAAALRIPTENLVDRHQLQRELAALDVHAVSIERCGAAVLDGFARYAPQRHPALWVTRALIRQLRRAPAIEYAVVSARCQSSRRSFG